MASSRKLEADYAIDVLRKTEWCPEFESKMRACLLMGAIRYGRLEDPNKPKYDYVDASLKRLAEYSRTGNRQLLVDVANFCLIEFHNDEHPLSHYDSSDAEHVPVKEHFAICIPGGSKKDYEDARKIIREQDSKRK